MTGDHRSRAMRTATSPISIEPAELASMLATLCSYENGFGPYHPQTLCLMVQVASAYWQAGEPGRARPLLERVVRDLGRFLDRDHDLRLRALATLRDLLVAQRDFGRAASVQTELLECQIRHLGSDHPETLATRADLATILWEKIGCDPKREV
jgi:hypothetical protein